MVRKYRKRIAACNHLLYLHRIKDIIMEKEQGINDLTFDNLLKASDISNFGHLYDGKCMIILNDRERDEELFKYPIRINAFIIVICSEGKIDFSCDLKHYTITANTAFLYRPGMIIQIHTKTPCKLTVLIFKQELLEQLNIKVRNIAMNFLKLKDAQYTSLATKDCEQLREIFSIVYAETKENDTNPYYHDMMESLITSGIYRLLYIMAHNFYDTAESTDTQTREEGYFKQFMKLLALNYRSHRSVQFYASQIHLNPKYLSSVIKNTSGKSPAEWINTYVILEAKNLIKYSDLSIQEIAYTLNFPNQSFFGKYFKRLTGMSPKTYRQQK